MPMHCLFKISCARLQQGLWKGTTVRSHRDMFVLPRCRWSDRLQAFANVHVSKDSMLEDIEWDMCADLQ
ncbi:hypothetical protein M3J09_000287 [Ascochyta lentis]